MERDYTEIFRIAVESAPLFVFIYRKRFIYANPYTQRVLGYTLDELKRKYVWDFLPRERRRAFRIIVEQKIKSDQTSLKPMEITIVTRSGDARRVRLYSVPVRWKGRMARLAVGIDITRERELEDRLRRERKRLMRLTLYDGLTGLPNRLLFTEKLKDLVKYADRRGELLCVILLDLARFKEINATYGMEVSDLLLREVGKRLAKSLRSADIIGRFFANEFGIAVAGLRDTSTISRVVERVRELFKKPFSVSGYQIFVDANLGVAVFPRDDLSPDGLIRKAELALSKAKESGSGGVSYFSEDVEKRVVELAVIRTSLSDAIKTDQIDVFFQPVVRLIDREVVGIEALARWKHPKMGIVPPSRFIPVAEETGLIHELGDAVLKKALDYFVEIRKLKENLFIAVNFSMKQFLEGDIQSAIRRELERRALPPESFVLEITESTAMKDPERTISFLSSLRQMGIKVAIDDFGTGYSSMNYLIKLEVDKIKVDRSFVDPVVENSRAQGIVRTVIELSHSVGAVALAEGIERESQLSKLIEMGCDEGQGYLFSAPLDFEGIKRLLEPVRT